MLLLAICAPVCCVMPRAQADDRVAVEWLRENAIPIKTVEAGNGFEDLQRVKQVVGDARIAELGESTHGTREVFPNEAPADLDYPWMDQAVQNLVDPALGVTRREARAQSIAVCQGGARTTRRTDRRMAPLCVSRKVCELGFAGIRFRLVR